MVSKFYTNCRGTNLVPVYKTVWAQYNGIPNEAARWYGNTGPLATWYFYNSQDVDDELRHLSFIGINTIRVFLHYEAWRGNRDQFVANLQDLAGLCDKYRIRTCLVFFDNVGVDPLWQISPSMGANPSGMTSIYTKSPSVSALSSAGAVTTFLNADGYNYMQDVVSAVSSYQSTLVYDAFNEPARGISLGTSTSSISVDSFLTLVLAKLKALDPHPSRKTTVGHSVITDFSSVSAEWFPDLSSANHDVISMHEYVLLSSVREQTYLERSNISTAFSKPFWVTECVNPDYFMTHNEIIDWYSQRKGLGVIGFCPTIGHPFSGESFKLFGTGLFYHNGTMKDNLEASAFIGRAKTLTNRTDRQLPDYIAVPEMPASDFDRDETKILTFSGLIPNSYATYQSLLPASEFVVSDMGYTNFVSFPGDASSAWPLATPFSQAYGIPDNSKIGKYSPVIKRYGRTHIVSAAHNWGTRTPLSSFTLPSGYGDLQKEKSYQANVLSILIRDLKIVNDTHRDLVGTSHERNLLGSDGGNARVLELALLNSANTLNNHSMLAPATECPSNASAIIYDVSYGIAMGHIVSAMTILGELN